MTVTTTQGIWNAYAEALQQKVAVQFDPTTQVITFAGTTLAADLANANPGISNQTVYQFGNGLPAYSPSYSRVGDLCTTYALFLDNIDLGGTYDPNLDSQINLANNQMNSAQSAFNSVQSQAFTQYQTYQQMFPGTSFNDFVTSNYPTYLTAEDTLQAAQSNYNKTSK